MNTYELVAEALVGLGIPPSDVTPDAMLVETLGVDSTELVELMATVASRAGVRADSKALKGAETVGDLAALIERLEPVPVTN